jgi:hypothetical protein
MCCTCAARVPIAALSDGTGYCKCFYVLQTHQDRLRKEQAMQQLHKVATHARSLQETLRQHIATVEAARARYPVGGAVQHPTAGTLLTPRSSNSLQGVTQLPYETATGAAHQTQHQSQPAVTTTPRQQAGSNLSGGHVPAASGMSAGYHVESTPATVASAPAAEGGISQAVSPGLGTTGQPTQPKAKLRIRARPSTAAAHTAAQAAATNAAPTRNDAGQPQGVGSTVNQQTSNSGAPSPRTVTPVSGQSMQTPVSAVTKAEGKPVNIYTGGVQMQHPRHMLPSATAGGHGVQQGVGSPDTAPSMLSSASAHRGTDIFQHPTTNYAYAAHPNNRPAAVPGGYSNAGATMPPQSIDAAAQGIAGDGQAAAGGATTAAASPHPIPVTRLAKAHCAPEPDYSNSGNVLRLSMVPDSAQKALLASSLHPTTHPVAPTSGIQSNSLESDSTEVLSGPLRTPAPTTVSVCDLDLSANDRYSAFSRSDPCAPMLCLPGKPALAASDASARPGVPPLSLQLPETEAARRLVSVCSTLEREFQVALQPAKCNPVYSQQDAFTVAVRPLTMSSPGRNGDEGSAEDNSWGLIDVIIDEEAWEAGRQMCVIAWPQVSSTARSMQGQASTEVREMAANELRALMQGLLSETGMAPSLRSIVDAWKKVYYHMSPKVAARLSQYQGTECVL